MERAMARSMGLVSAVVLSLAVAAPAAALQRFNVFVSGELVLQPSRNPIIGMPFGTGTTLVASWDVDLTKATRTALAPVGGTGTAANFGGVVSNGELALANDTTILLIDQNASSEGFIFAFDNATGPAAPPPAPPPPRFDQVTINDGAAYGPDGPAPTYDLIPIIGLFPPDLFVSSVLFGRSQFGPTEPTLIDTTETIDPFGLWQFGFPTPQPSFGLTLRQGSATTPAGAASLPFSTFTLRNASVFISELPTDIVPEPGTWATMIAGFGLVGAAARRRRRLAAA
jgi:hypothetical protein